MRKSIKLRIRSTRSNWVSLEYEKVLSVSKKITDKNEITLIGHQFRLLKNKEI
jgi:hypothetical protein